MRRLLLLATLLASGCVSATESDPYDTRLELAPAFHAPHVVGDVAAGAWWSQLGDPQLAAIVEEALLASHDLGAAAARVRQAAALGQEARAARGPQVNVGLDGARRRQNFIGFPLPGGGVPSSTTTVFNLGLSASWEADLWGRLASGVSAAEADERAAQADLAGAQLSVIAQTAQGWFALREAELQHALAQRTLASFEDNERWIRERYENGLTPPLDLRFARSNVELARGQLAETQRVRDMSGRALERMLGRYPSGELLAGGTFAELPAPVPPGVPAQLLERRPDLVAAQLRVEAASARTKQSRAALYPSLVLTGSGGSASEGLEDLLDGDFRVWSLGANLLAPILDGGSRRAAVAGAEARRDEALALFADDVLGACYEVETALASEGLIQSHAAHLQAAFEEANAALLLARDQYRSGLGGLLPVLESERRAFNAESQWLAARRALVDNRINLHIALGGGFQLVKPDGAEALQP